jgi:uncharacterized glyoxalase superfamily protein PhnB
MTVALEAGLVGRDEQVLIAFYTDVIGFELTGRLQFDVGVVCKLRRGAARLKIFFPRASVDRPATIEPWFRPGGWRYAALNLERLEDVDALAAAAVASGCGVLLEPSSHRPGARAAMIIDPEGHAWELLAEAPTDGDGAS